MIETYKLLKSTQTSKNPATALTAGISAAIEIATFDRVEQSRFPERYFQLALLLK